MSGYLANIFISHKHEYGTEARDLREKLYFLGAGRIKFFLSEEIPPGADWRDWIEESLGESNILLFLYMNPANSWDWCLYETGLFDGLNKGYIIVLHNTDSDPPSPLGHLETVRANVQGVKKFLKNLYGTTNYGIAEPINLPHAENEKALEEDAVEICDLFSAFLSKSQYYTNRMIVRINSEALLSNRQIPDDSIIEADSETLKLFGLRERVDNPWTWQDISQHSDDKDWMKVLGKSIYYAGKDEYFEPSKASFQLKNGKIFSPILYRSDERNDGTLAFHISFIEDITEGIVAYAPETLATLLSTLTLGSRFQWELCVRYLKDIKKWKTNEEIKNGCRAIRESLNNIQREANIREQREFHGNKERDRLTWAFDSLEEQQYIENNLAEQLSYKQELCSALEEKNLEKAEELLRKLQGLNLLLVTKITSRYADLWKRIPSYNTDI